MTTQIPEGIFTSLDPEVYSKVVNLAERGNFNLSQIEQPLVTRILKFPVDSALEMLSMACEEIENTTVDKIAFLEGVVIAFEHKIGANTKNEGAIIKSEQIVENVPIVNAKLHEKQETIVKDYSVDVGKVETGEIDYSTRQGLDEDRIKAFCDGTGYSLEITSGQRKYGGPPPNWEGEEPDLNHQVFVGGLPKNYFEDAFIPAFSRFGKIYEFRTMMDSQTGLTKGFGFITFVDTSSAERVLKELNTNELFPGMKVNVNKPDCNVRLFLGNIPRHLTREKIIEQLGEFVDGVMEVLIYADKNDPSGLKTRGFCFVDFKTHKYAAQAKKKIGFSGTQLWKCNIVANWADKQDQFDDSDYDKVKVVFMKKVPEGTSKNEIVPIFEPFGVVENVRFSRELCFVHFEKREVALKAVEELNGKTVNGFVLDIKMANPYNADKAKQKKIIRERRQSDRYVRPVAHGNFQSPMPVQRYGDQYNYYNEVEYPVDYAVDPYSNQGYAPQIRAPPHMMYAPRYAAGPRTQRHFKREQPMPRTPMHYDGSNKRRMSAPPRGNNTGNMNWAYDQQY